MQLLESVSLLPRSLGPSKFDLDVGATFVRGIMLRLRCAEVLRACWFHRVFEGYQEWLLHITLRKM